jgi:hypothetical protein
MFAFGLMLWEMVSRSRIYRAFPGFENDDEAPATVTANGNAEVDVSQIAARLARGQRPGATADCPEVLYSLMQACWAHTIADRPTAAQVLSVIKGIRRQKEQGGVHANVLEPPGSGSGSSGGGGGAEHEEITYDGFLQQLGLMERKEDLAEYLSKPGAELTELIQMDEDDLQDDILDDPDLGFSEETKTAFREAVTGLRESSANDEGDTVGDAAVAAVDARSIAAWSQLVQRFSDGSAEPPVVTELREALDASRRREQQKDEEIEEKDEEIERLRKQLASK